MTHGNDLLLGYAQGDDGRPLRLSRRQRAMHLYLAGATGTGKSKQIESCVRQDILARPTGGCGLMVLDLHGALFESVMDWVVSHDLRHLPIWPMDLSRNDWIIAYNPLRPRPEAEADTAVIVAHFVRAIAHAWGASDLSQTPRLAKWLRVMLATLYEQRATLGEILRLVRSPDYRQDLARQVQDPVARAVWQMSGCLKEEQFQEQVESTVNRVVKFLSTQVVRATLCQTGLSLDLAAALRRGAIVPVSLATRGGRIDEEDAITFGSVLLSDLWSAAQSRGKPSRLTGAGHKPFYLYLDEFQEFVTPVMAKTLDQARGFGLHLTLAHQFPSQLLSRGEHGRQVFDSVMANARTKLVFQTDHPMDVKVLAEWLSRSEVDVDAVKYQGYSTQTIGHRIEYLASTSSSTTAGSSEGENWSDTDSESTTHGTNESTTESETHTLGTSETHGRTIGTSVSESDGMSVSDSLTLGVQAGSSRALSHSRGENWSTTDGESEGETEGRSLARSVSRSLGDPSDPLREELEDEEVDYDTLLDTDADGSEPEIVDGEWIEPMRDPAKAARLDRATRRVSIGQTGTESNSLTRSRSRSEAHGGSRSDGDTRGVSRGLSLSAGQTLGRSHNTTLTESDSETESFTDSESHSTGLAHTRGTSEATTKGLANSRGGSRGTNHAVTNGTTRSPVVMPILSREPTTPVYRTVEEQMFMATQRLASQPQRHCLARLAGTTKPVAVVTPLVTPAYVTPKYRDRWLVRLLKKLPFALPMADALARLKPHGEEPDEPMSNRRLLP